MSYGTGKDRNMLASLKRCMSKAWFGESQPVEEFAIPVLLDNGEALPVPNGAGNAPIGALSVSSANIAYIPIGKPVAYRCLANAELGTTRFFISDSYYRVAGIRFIYKTAGTSASIAIQVTKDVLSATT